MVNLVDFSDTQFLVPCEHCAELLQDGDRFCRFCGEPQWEGAEAAYGDVEAAAGRPALPFAGGSEIAMDRAAAVRAARKGGRPQFALVHRGQLERQAPPPDAPAGWARNSLLPSPMVLGIAAAVVVLFALVLMHDLYRENQREAERLQQLSGKLDEMQRALSQGELGAVESTLDSLGAASAQDPRVQALREALDEKQPAAGERAARPPAAVVASPAPEVAPVPASPPATPVTAAADVPAASTAPVAAPAAPAPAASPAPTPAAEAKPAAPELVPPAPRAPPIVVATPAPPAPLDGVPEPQASGCSQVLAALSLCSRE